MNAPWFHVTFATYGNWSPGCCIPSADQLHLRIGNTASLAELPPFREGTTMTRIRCRTVALVSVLLAPIWVGAATLHVPAVHPTIQACIDAAVSGIDECVVAPGAYYGRLDFLGRAIIVRSSHGPDVTTIEASGAGGSAVSCVSGEGPDTVLDGFTISGGTGSSLSEFVGGGGMINVQSSPTVRNCIFRNNGVFSKWTPYQPSFGGGMGNFQSSPTVINCAFIDNTSITSSVDTPGRGGGMYNYESSPTLNRCEFRWNSADTGGGMYNESSSPIVTDCTFRSNTSLFAGGGVENVFGNPEFTNCRFIGNSTGWEGGGLDTESSSARLSDCDFIQNVARYGGGVSGYSPLHITRCRFLGNHAQSQGGAIMVFWPTPGHLIRDSEFVGNSAFAGGAIYNDSLGLTVESCTLTGNVAASFGAAFVNSLYARAVVAHSILWSDLPAEFGIVEWSVLEARFNDFQGGIPWEYANDGVGNIDFDPMFVRTPNPGADGIWDGIDDDYGDLRLQPGSPCINAGDPDFVPADGETDLDGRARVLCGRVDMGAYEFGIGDFDCDQTVNLLDFAAWEDCMTGPTSSPTPQSPSFCTAFDFDFDGDVDLVDWAGLQRILAP